MHVPWSGRVWRYVPRGAHALHFGYVLRARGRWNRAGQYGALYLALTADGARAEHAKYAAATALNGLPFGPHELVSLDVSVTAALDLTDPATLRRFGVTTAALREEGAAGHERCREFADLARAGGTYVLFVPSAPLAGATNLIIYSDVPPSVCQLDVGPDRLPI
jgi:RES domain-containing protein